MSIPKLIYRVDYSYYRDGDEFYYITHNITSPDQPRRKYCARYDKWVSLPQDYHSDGASGTASDVGTAWLWHDRLCEVRKWEDGSEASAWQASAFLKDCLAEEGRPWRSNAWALATYFWQRARGHK